MKVPFLDLRAGYLELKTEIDSAIQRVLDSGYYIHGPEVEAFETEWASYCSAKHAVALGNGMDALVLALRSLDVGPGDEVIVPSNTYIATWLAVSAVGATPVPVEPELTTYNIDPCLIERAITPATKVLLPVHLYGHPADLALIMQLARHYKLAIVEDAAQAHGARYRGKRIGAHGDIVCWSFYPGKNLGALGDAGAITTNRSDLADRIRVLRNYGSREKYVNEVRGVNSRLDPLQAAVLRVKLRALDEWIERRQKIASLYLDALTDNGLILPYQQNWAEHVWHLFVVRSLNRSGLQQKLIEANISSLIHYPIAPHQQQAYEGTIFSCGSLPLAEQISREVLSLPISPHLLPDQVASVIKVVNQ